MILSDFENKYKEIYSLISKGKLKRALELTGELVDLLNAKDEQKELTKLWFRFNSIDKVFNVGGTVEYKEFALEQNRIAQGLLQSLLPNLEKEYLESRK